MAQAIEKAAASKPGEHRMKALPNYLSEWLKSALFNLYEGSTNAYIFLIL